MVYSEIKQSAEKMINKWLDFFLGESCGKCTACREGVYRLKEIVISPSPNWPLFRELLDNLEETSFCGLGCAVPGPIKSYINNVLGRRAGSVFKNLDQKVICECFK
jgi:NADH:ubiquinone oxidoreductase subunit F (NADH-binding)